MSLMYLYLRNQFGFKEIEFSLFKAYTMVVMLLGKIYSVLICNFCLFIYIIFEPFTGSVFTLVVLSRTLKINDAILGLIATVFDIITCVGFLLATQYKHLLFGKYTNE